VARRRAASRPALTRRFALYAQPIGTIEDGDAVVLFNFRSDRMVELSKAFEYTEPGKFTSFDRERVPNTKFVGMMQYDGDLHLPKNYLVPPPTIAKVSGEWLAKNGLRTFACSETQKFGHVTFFWNGNRSVRRAACPRKLLAMRA
jgi:2,3-bisphosphoglycerate-independent phosphoglycerate mutase